jgi:hypothetical protein
MKLTTEWVIRLLLVCNVIVVALLLGVVVYSSLHTTPGTPAQLNPSPSPSGDLMAMGNAHIPTTNSCVLCHEEGGSEVKVIPAVGHPLEGWRTCSACHTGEKLGREAPGHEGISDGECLNCHKEAVQGVAITQPHLKLQDRRCFDCHGSYAHLPSTMAGRDEDQCVLCHKPTAYPPPISPHLHETVVGCRSCHQSPEVGGLPIDHALRADSTCLLCHDIEVAQNGPGASYPLVSPGVVPSALPSSSPGVPPSASP